MAQTVSQPAVYANVCYTMMHGSTNIKCLWCFESSGKITLLHINPLNAELNPICYLLALLGAQNILRVSGIRVKSACSVTYNSLQERFL